MDGARDVSNVTAGIHNERGVFTIRLTTFTVQEASSIVTDSIHVERNLFSRRFGAFTAFSRACGRIHNRTGVVQSQ